MTKFEKQWWEQERAKGYDRFLLRSLLRAGLPFGILMTLAHVLWPVFSHQPIPQIYKLLVEFGFYVVGFGAFMGVVTWRGNERNYNKPTEDDDVA
jgi:hypothetical protein